MSYGEVAHWNSDVAAHVDVPIVYLPNAQKNLKKRFLWNFHCIPVLKYSEKAFVLFFFYFGNRKNKTKQDFLLQFVYLQWRNLQRKKYTFFESDIFLTQLGFSQFKPCIE